jgi:hypothetical protein
MKFSINIFIYIIFSILEVNALSKIANQITNIMVDRKKELRGVIILALIVVALDTFVFDYTKTGVRTASFMSLLYVMFKYAKPISFTKAGIQMIMVMVVTFVLDLIVYFSVKSFPGFQYGESDDFTVLYAVMLTAMYVTLFVMKRFNISFINLSKSNL